MAIFTSKDLPNVRPVADFNFAATKTLDKRITFSRGSIGTYTDELSIVRYASNNVPRFDHDPTTGESLGLLVEESRTNQMINSSDITGATAQNGTITGNATTAPDGTTTADKYAANSTNGIHRVDLAFTSGQISNSTAYTFSVFVKANGYDKLHIRYAGYGADDHGRGYDLSDGSTFDGKFDGTGALGAVTSSSIIEYPNDWYRCSFTFTTASNAASGAANILYYVSNSEATTNFAGDGSSGMYFWGAQMEVGSFVTSLIPTLGSTVTRAQDQTIIKKESFTKIFDSGFNSFSALVDYDNLSTSDGPVYDILTLWGESTGYTDRISISKDNASPYHIETRAFGNNAAIFNNGNFTAASKAAVQRLAFSWDVPSYSSSTGKAWKFSFSGANVGNVSASSTQGLPALTRMGIGINPTRLTEAAGRTHFKRVAIYNQVLSEEELKSISAI